MKRTIIIGLLLGCLNSNACELLVKAREVAHSNPVKDRVGRMKIGMIVDIREDGFRWGRRETLPRFALIKLPGVDVAKAVKYLAPQMDESTLDADGNPTLYRPRVWQIQVSSLPLAARNKLSRDGELTIKASVTYAGSYDYTWTQVREFFRNLKTNTTESGNL